MLKPVSKLFVTNNATGRYDYSFNIPRDELMNIAFSEVEFVSFLLVNSANHGARLCQVKLHEFIYL